MCVRRGLLRLHEQLCHYHLMLVSKLSLSKKSRLQQFSTRFGATQVLPHRLVKNATLCTPASQSSKPGWKCFRTDSLSVLGAVK